MDKWMQEAQEIADILFVRKNLRHVLLSQHIATALSSAFEAGRKEERERAAQIVETSQGQQLVVDVFVFNGAEAKNKRGHTEFVSLPAMDEFLRSKAAAIRSREDKA